jgi:hypothetical protein
MSDAPWLDVVRSDTGQNEHTDNATIVAKARFIGQTFPEMREYCASYTDAEKQAWCGVEAGYAMAKCGIRPPFVKGRETSSFMWANSWQGWGEERELKPGAVVCLDRHVTICDHVDGDTVYCRGGNQSDQVKVSPYSRSKIKAVRWPSTAASAPGPEPAPVASNTELRHRMGEEIMDYEARRDQFGHVQVYRLPAGDGGGTYEVAGLNDRYHPEEAEHAAALVAQGRYDEAEAYVADFIVKYTDVAAKWTTDPGLEFYLRDCVYNRGPTGAAWILQIALGVDVDGEVGPITMGALQAAKPGELLDELRPARETYEREHAGRDESSKFWKGLVNRWNNALATAKRFQDEAKPPEPAPAPAPVSPKPEPQEPTMPDTPAPVPPKPSLPKIDRDDARAVLLAIVNSPEFRAAMRSLLTKMVGSGAMASMGPLGILIGGAVFVLGQLGQVGDAGLVTSDTAGAITGTAGTAVALWLQQAVARIASRFKQEG